MSKPYVMRQADPSDLDTAMRILEERRLWLRERGSDQWNHGKEYRDRMVTMIERGHTWILEDDGLAIGTATARRRTTSRVWTSEELTEPALYGWKMATTMSRNGEGLGVLILRWLQDRAAGLDLMWMRWSAWRTNEQLREYYRRIGAEFVRFAEVNGEEANALFQLPARFLPNPSEVVTVFDETRDDTADPAAGGDPACGDPGRPANGQCSSSGALTGQQPG